MITAQTLQPILPTAEPVVGNVRQESVVAAACANAQQVKHTFWYGDSELLPSGAAGGTLRWEWHWQLSPQEKAGRG